MWSEKALFAIPLLPLSGKAQFHVFHMRAPGLQQNVLLYHQSIRGQVKTNK